MKKKISALLLAALVGCIAAGCGNSQSSQGENASGTEVSSNEAGGSDEQITIRFLHQWAEENRLPYWNALTESYMAEHPNVKIETEVIPNEAYKEKIRIMLGGDDMPDLFFTWDGEWV